METYVRAIHEGDFGEACGQLTEEAERDAVQFLSQEAPQLGADSCRQFLDALQGNGSIDFAVTGVMDRDRAPRESLPYIEVEDVEVRGERASARVDGSRKLVHLAEVDGEWRIAELDFAGVPRRKE